MKRIVRLIRLGNIQRQTKPNISNQMKTFASLPQVRIKLFLLTLPLLVFSSCLDGVEDTEPTPAAYVSIYQGAPSAPAMDVFADANQVNRQLVDYTESLSYSPFFIGQRQFRLINPVNSGVLLERTVQLENDKIYSLFIHEMGSDLELTLAEDAWDEGVEGEAQLRFVHLSPDAGEVYVELSGRDTPFFPSTSLSGVTEFNDLPTGTYDIQVKSIETDAVLFESNEVEINDLHVYTLLLRGLVAESSGMLALNLQLVTNYRF